MNPSSSDLAERFARTQGWTRGPHGWIEPDERYVGDLPAIGVSILPIIWADCKAKGWTWDMARGLSSVAPRAGRDGLLSAF